MTSETPAISVSMPYDDIALITMDLPGTGANILNDQLFDELDKTMAELASNEKLAGVILYSAKPSIFVAGADLNNIVANLDWPDEDIVRFCEQGRAVMARFSRCPFVSVAAIHGACVGGGLELALWCDCRVASDHRRTVLGLPEVKLGLVPGWAGTARLPRIANLKTATDLVCSGRLVSAKEALEMKFIDSVVEQGKLIEESVAVIRRVQTSESFISARRSIMGCVPGIDPNDAESSVEKIGAVVREVGAEIVSNQEIFPYAPTVALEHMTRTSSLSLKEAWDSESLAMAQVWGSPASRGLLNHFFLTDRNKKEPGIVDLTLKTTPVETVGIVGAGLMGRAIAANCLKFGINVVMLDANSQAAQSAVKSLSKIGKGAKAKKKCSIKSTEDYADFADVEIVIESVVETLDVKTIVLKRIEDAIPATTIIASNTSAIPIEKLALNLTAPDRLCGIHFCHPELMSMVEVICGPETSEQTVATAVKFVQSLRKMPVAMNDGPGFVVNRLLAAMLDQSLRLYNQGVEIETIDEAFREFGFLGGPFEIIDVIGVDTCMYAGRTMWEAGLQCVSLSPILPKLMKSGRLGRKSGKGFYNYADQDQIASPGSAQSLGERDEEFDTLISVYRDDEPTQQDLPRKMIVQRVLAAVALEATRIMDEEIVADPRDIDLCIIHGFSFPKHQGGILFWADQLTWQTIKESLYKISQDEPRLDPNEIVKDLANNKKTVYQT